MSGRAGPRPFGAGLGMLLSALLLARPAVPEPAPQPPVAASLEGALAGLPGRNMGRGGRPGDPMNLLFLGNDASVRGALTEAGWTQVPLGIPGSVWGGLMDLLSGKRLTRFPPFNHYGLDGRDQSMNWAQTVRPLAERHHFRLWKLALRDAGGRTLWWGSGNYDVRIRWRDLSHVPDPDMNAEREHVRRSLEGSRWVAGFDLKRLPQVPTEGANDKGYPFRTDGHVLVVMLRDVPGERHPK